MTVTRDNVQLPKLAQQPSPNFSERNLQRGHAPYLIVLHRPVGSYHGSADYLCKPSTQASAHILTEGNGTGVDVATQLVPWDKKAWACMAFNSISYNLEIDDDAWSGKDKGALLTAQRITAFICHKTGIPPRWSHSPLHDAGICRHYDLGRAGGGHTDPTTNDAEFRAFLAGVRYQLERGGFRATWGKGRFQRIAR